MCEFCNNAKSFKCKILIEGKTFARNINGILEAIPIYSEITAPTNYCPSCGKKVKEK